MKKFAFAALGATMALGLAACGGDKYEKAGLVVEEEDGRLWVFQKDSEFHKQFEAVGEPAKQFTAIGVGPNGETVKAADQAVLEQYLMLSKEG